MNRWTVTALLGVFVVLGAPARHARAADHAAGVAGHHHGFFVQSADGQFGLHIHGRVQVRYESLFPETGNAEHRFSVPRVRLKLKGHLFGKDLRYGFQFDFGKGGVRLKDAYASYALAGRLLVLEMGQFKRPFSRQYLTSSQRLAFVDRSFTQHAFGVGRDLGLMLSGKTGGDSQVRWSAGLFNGTGAKGKFKGAGSVAGDGQSVEVTSGKFSNVPSRLHPSVLARVEYAWGGIRDFDEVDLEGGAFRFAVGLGAWLDLDADHSHDAFGRGDVDWIAKIAGFCASGAFYAGTRQKSDRATDQELDRWGFDVQANYVWKGRFGPAARFAQVTTVGRQGGPDTLEREALFGFNVFFHGHEVKWQTDAGVLTENDGLSTAHEWRVRTQFQLAY